MGQDKFCRAIFDNEDEEGIYVFCTDERSRASPYPTFLGGTKSLDFCFVGIGTGTGLGPMHVKCSTRQVTVCHYYGFGLFGFFCCYCGLPVYVGLLDRKESHLIFRPRVHDHASTNMGFELIYWGLVWRNGS